MKKSLPKTSYSVKNQQGIVLLEALIAILIFSFGILALVGLQAAMLKNTDDAKYRSEASYIAQQQLGFMWANPDNLSTFVGTTDISARLPNGSVTIAQPATSRVSITVNWQVPGQDPHQYVANTYVLKGK